ncbi:MAG: AAA family ATPase [Gammaproteobacteria bacterium]|jgi:5-methylcytosine-specific restriction protein B|nr:AAA family ATPase [Gammaproteobacteria bacterium]
MSIEALTAVIVRGVPTSVSRDALAEQTRAAIEGLFGSRYQALSRKSYRVALMPSTEGVSFAGLVHEDSPTSGVYGGMSLIWFPVEGSADQPPASLLTLVCGTRGLAPDEQVLGRPGHARHLQALRRHLRESHGVSMWVKHDPANLAEPFPRVMRDRFARFRHVLDRYGNYIYAAVEVPREVERASGVVAALLDFYAWERGWTPLKRAREEADALKLALRANLFPRVTAEKLHALLRERRFVVLQGPPGTGKTRLATETLREHFADHGMAVQFHPAVTYETFVAGIAPDVNEKALHFGVRSGWLVEAAHAAQNGRYLLVIDEINRADLGRVLGEAIFLLESREISRGMGRRVRLPNALDTGADTLEIPQGLYILGTMNSADRSIAILDLAVRRRFAFVEIWPDIDVVAAQQRPLATEAFGRLLDVFAQFAPDDALVLVPGHAYFLSDTDAELANRLRYELAPLLREYLQDGRLGACESELRAYLDWLDTEVDAVAGST